MKFHKTNIPGYVKDVRSGVVLNTNVGELQTIRAARKRAREHEELSGKIARLEALLERTLKTNGG
jgi:hypothetical protein